jgi:hypothetical protein
MSLPVVVFPDAEQLVVEYLADRLGGAAHVGTELPEDLADEVPVVAVSLVDADEALEFVLEDPVVDIEVVAANKAAASDVARLVSAYMKAMPGLQTADARVYRVKREGFTWLPDEVTELPRYVLTFELRTRPA